MAKIRIAIWGVGNCASSLVQGIAYYKDKKDRDAIGLMHWDIGGYKPYDMKVVAAFDIDKRTEKWQFFKGLEFIAGRRED